MDAGQRLHRIAPSFWLPPQMAELYANPEKKIQFAGEQEITPSMKWLGLWSRESSYEPEDVVRYNGKAYVCYNSIDALVNALGPGFIVPNSPEWEVPKAGEKAAPRGQLTLGQFGGVLNTSDYHSKPELIGGVQPLVVNYHQVWQLMLHESTVENELIFSGLVSSNKERFLRGHQTLQIYVDNGELAYNSGEGFEGPLKILAIKKFVKPTKVGSDYRFYVVISGGTYEFEKPSGEQKGAQCIPLPYEVTAEGTAIDPGVGNPSPSEDFEHWALLSGA